MHINLTGKNALVAGSTQGIGKATALQLAQAGANVILVARNETKLKAVLEELSQSNDQQHHYLVADFSQPEAVEAIVRKFLQDHSTIIHIVINNTGGPKGGPIADASPEDFLHAYNMHLVCNHLLSQLTLPGMKTAGYGRIINVTSTSVKEPIPGLGVSNTTRWAVASWGKTLAGEVAPFGITVNTVLPGFTWTERLKSLISSRATAQHKTEEEVAEGMRQSVPCGRFADAVEVANAILFLSSPLASYINGIVLPVDGGRTRSL
ncbi:MAG: SDR family oxidoreductase [Bacteroidota bacterium]